MNELKPCPMCGGEAQILWCDGAGRYRLYSPIDYPVFYGNELQHRMIECTNCGLKTKPYFRLNNLIKAWNRRVDDDT